MDFSSIVTVVQSLGFPIVCCGAMAWYVKYITDKNRESTEKLNEQHKQEISELNEQHKQETSEMTKAIENNTLAITKLCEKLGGVNVEIQK